ncbi:hypothetical protein RvY_00260 [Ramazzottius varieornatus]|uniref:Uncharacterized protein n=1 Tax=Ramazzottius varieornatus TaxID=947166 RepID=A0A1D1UMN4_RAMVA|nr:hypothetical protein RvY_00260 [Ramazzottius varieornatus]
MVYVVVKWFGTIRELVFSADQTEVRLVPLKELTPEEHDEDGDDDDD